MMVSRKMMRASCLVVFLFALWVPSQSFGQGGTKGTGVIDRFVEPSPVSSDFLTTFHKILEKTFRDWLVQSAAESIAALFQPLGAQPQLDTGRPDAQIELEDAGKVINESLEPSRQSPEASAARPPRPDPERTDRASLVERGSGDFGPLRYALPEGWSVKHVGSHNGPPFSYRYLTVENDGREFSLVEYPPQRARMVGIEYTPEKIARHLKAALVSSSPVGPTRVLSLRPGVTIGTTTVGKDEIPGVTAREGNHVIVLFQHDDMIYMSGMMHQPDRATYEARQAFLDSLDTGASGPLAVAPEPAPAGRVLGVASAAGHHGSVSGVAGYRLAAELMLNVSVLFLLNTFAPSTAAVIGPLLLSKGLGGLLDLAEEYLSRPFVPLFKWWYSR